MIFDFCICGMNDTMIRMCLGCVVFGQVEISPSYFGVKPEDLNVHAAAARADNRPMPAKPIGHVRGHTGMVQKPAKVTCGCSYRSATTVFFLVNVNIGRQPPWYFVWVVRVLFFILFSSGYNRVFLLFST